MKRFWEVDFLRGLAVILMIISHFFYYFAYFNEPSVFWSGTFLFWKIIARTSAIIFIFLVGISLTLSYSKRKKVRTKKELRIKYFKRGLKIFSLGILISLITFIFVQEHFVIFGILHFIGISIIIASFFLRKKQLNLVIGTLLIIIGIYLSKFAFDFNWLIWLGFFPKGVSTLDYFPLLPWFGVVLLGIFFGNLLYSNYKRKFKIKDISEFELVKSVCFLGRNSLIIYFIHQPILLLLILGVF